MQEAASTTRWRDENQKVVPRNYDDLANLVALARRARRTTVEFDWVFTREDLERLRRAVYEWGRATVGRYKYFDSQVLAAINDALYEPTSVFTLRAPKRGGDIDCRVSCTAEGAGFRLRGHAPFDVIFGYGSAGIAPNPWAEHLGPSAQKTLANAVGLLEWDLRLLQGDRFRPVRNVIYGFPAAYGVETVGEPIGPALDVHLHFHGPFSAVHANGCRSLFSDELTKRTGVYLWTLNVKGQERLRYVGQTRVGFGARMAQHLASFLTGEYPIQDLSALARGELVGLVHGFWPQRLPSILQDYGRLVPHIIGVIRRLTVHLAPLDGDAHLHNRVEGAIGRYFQRHADAQVRDFFMPGLRIPAAIPGDRAVNLIMSTDVPIAGFPSELRE